MKRERCSCKDFEAVAAKDSSIFNEAMYNCKCFVGKTFNKCDNPKHIQALDYRAATFEAMGELERAKKDAEWMLELAPRFPDVHLVHDASFCLRTNIGQGYLRLGKVARLQKKSEFAWKVYNAGILACKDNEMVNLEKAQVRSRKSSSLMSSDLDQL